MIEINLLPKQYLKSSRSFSFGKTGLYAVAAAAGIVLMLVGISFYQMYQLGRLESDIEKARARAAVLQKDIQVAQEETQKLAPQIARMKQLTKERDQVDRRLDAITMLDKDRYVRVRLMSELSRRMPANTWLTLYQEVSPTTVKLEGITFSNFIVADFMRNQAKSDSYRSVDLDFIEKGKIGDINVLKFGLTAQVGEPATDVATGM